mmetsp:Transcript_100805/g.256474  ORF Transcript_100805/g.256474 Transcript_100805/m.256474 type:complete len:262 (-) Transcript_100805:215-1000(-)
MLSSIFTTAPSNPCVQQRKGRACVVLCTMPPGENVARDGVGSGHAEGKQEDLQHVRRSARPRRTLGQLRVGGGGCEGGSSVGDGHSAVDLLLVPVVVVVVARLAVSGFAVVGVIALLGCIGIVNGIVALAGTLVCERIVPGILVGLATLNASKIDLVLQLDGLKGVLLEALRHILLDLLLLGLAPSLELILGLAIHGARWGRRPLGLTSDANEVLAVLLLDWCLSEVLVGLGRILVDAIHLLVVPCLQLLSGVAIHSRCWP